MEKLDELMSVLLEQVKKLSDDTMNDGKLAMEIDRGRSMALLASQYIAAEQTKMRQELVAQSKGIPVRELRYLENGS